MYKTEDGSYGIPEELTKSGDALIFIKKIEDNKVTVLSKEVKLNEGINKIYFENEDLYTEEIHIGDNINPLDDSVFVSFENLPMETEIELKMHSGDKKTFYLNKNLKIYDVCFSDVLGRTGVNISKRNDFNFTGNYYAKFKKEYAIMSQRPSFDELFDICDSSDTPVGDMFIMGEGGGCDYKCFKDGKVMLESRFGAKNNPLHFENLEEGLYDMEFNFHDGDLVVSAKNVKFVKSGPLEIKVNKLPISGSGLDFNELMKNDSSHIIFKIEENDFLDGNILIYNDMDLFDKNNKTFSIETNFIRVDFYKELISEMVKVKKDLSMHIKNGLSEHSREEVDQFLRETYKIEDNMDFVCDYEVKIYLTKNDLIGGEFPKRPVLTFMPYDNYIPERNFEKITVFSNFKDSNQLEPIISKNENGKITISLEKPVPYYYFNLFEIK